MKKPRSDAVLLNLPEEQQAELAQWLLTGMPYHEALVMVEKRFGVKLRSLDCFRKFWNEVCAPMLMVRRNRALGTAEQRAEAAAITPGQFDAATIDAIKQRAYELAESPEARPGDVKAILGLVLKARDQDLHERQIALMEAKARKAEQAEAITKSDLTAEQKAARMREVFGIA